MSELFTEADYENFLAAQQVAKVIREEAARRRRRGAVVLDPRDYGIIPVKGQVEEGLILDCYMGFPSLIHTRCGAWQFHGGAQTAEPARIVEDILTRLGAQMLRGPHDAGRYGPLYAITTIDKLVLPTPVSRQKKDYVDVQPARATWTAMTERFEREENK